jgi:hypothetical protein
MENTKQNIDGKERVAFDLMIRISQLNIESEAKIVRDRKYYLTLFRECLWATNSPKDPKDID